MGRHDVQQAVNSPGPAALPCCPETAPRKAKRRLEPFMSILKHEQHSSVSFLFLLATLACLCQDSRDPQSRVFDLLWACAEVRQEGSGLMVMDMGQHVVQDYPQPMSLHQVLLPGLEDRARAFPPLTSARQLAPGLLPLPVTPLCPVLPVNQPSFALSCLSPRYAVTSPVRPRYALSSLSPTAVPFPACDSSQRCSALPITQPYVFPTLTVTQPQACPTLPVIHCSCALPCL